MVFKINLSTKDGKTFKLETEAESLIGKELHNKIDGKDISPDLEGYELEITGASDKSGFTAMKEVEGIGLKKVLLTYGKGMKKRPRREGKKKMGRNKPKGLRLRKTVRGKVISESIVQINLKVLKEGKKKLGEVFAEQSKAPEKEKKTVEPPKEKEAPKKADKPKEEAEEKKQEVKKEKKPAEHKEDKKAEEKPKETETKKDTAKKENKE